MMVANPCAERSGVRIIAAFTVRLNTTRRRSRDLCGLRDTGPRLPK